MMDESNPKSAVSSSPKTSRPRCRRLQPDALEPDKLDNHDRAHHARYFESQTLYHVIFRTIQGFFLLNPDAKGELERAGQVPRRCALRRCALRLTPVADGITFM